jgi:hypothetical protein
MRALILVAGAALAVSACSSNESAENTTNLDEGLAAENIVANDPMADMNMGMDANMTMNAGDANMTMNAGDANMSMNTDMNATTNATNAM